MYDQTLQMFLDTYVQSAPRYVSLLKFTVSASALCVLN